MLPLLLSCAALVYSVGWDCAASSPQKGFDVALLGAFGTWMTVSVDEVLKTDAKFDYNKELWVMLLVELSRDQPGWSLSHWPVRSKGLYFCCLYIPLSSFLRSRLTVIFHPLLSFWQFPPALTGPPTSFTSAHTHFLSLPLRLFLWPTIVRPHHVFPIMLSSHPAVNPQPEI